MATSAPMTPAEQRAYALAHTPGMPPPHPGIKPNFVDPYSQAYLITDVTIVTLTVTTLLVAIRTYTRRFIHKLGMGWEDYLSILAWAGYVAYASVGYQTFHYGGFVHMWNVPVIKVMKFLQTVNYVYILYCPVVFITKLSILVQLLHIFAPTRSGTTYYLCHFMIWFNLLFYTAIFFVAVFVCNPRAKFWSPTTPGTCVDINSVNIITSVINAVSDLVLLLLPIICVWKLQMNLRKKLGVSAIFATAAFACLSSIMRIVTSIEVVGTKDVTWYLLPEGLWALGEISGGIICGCMPALPQFFRHFVPKITTALGASGRRKAAKYSASSDQSDRIRSPKAAYAGSAYGVKDAYVELGERGQQLNAFDLAKPESRVCADEVSPYDEEKALTPIAEDGLTHSPRIENPSAGLRSVRHVQ